MSKIPNPHFQMEIWDFFVFFFSIFCLINFGIVYIWPIYQSLDKRILFTIIFFFFFQGTHLYMSLFLSICPSVRLLHTISQESYIILSSSLVHMCKMMISPSFFSLFLKFWFFRRFEGGRGGEIKGQKIAQNVK